MKQRRSREGIETQTVVEVLGKSWSGEGEVGINSAANEEMEGSSKRSRGEPALKNDDYRAYWRLMLSSIWRLLDGLRE